eukprot:scaffold28720_cov45-Phaeocystis_antarctica.AAC.1
MTPQRRISSRVDASVRPSDSATLATSSPASRRARAAARSRALQGPMVHGPDGGARGDESTAREREAKVRHETGRSLGGAPLRRSTRTT